MNVFKNINTFIIIVLTFVGLSSCVGTVEDKNPKTTKAAEIPKANITFGGLTKVVAISHDKVELYWSPAPGSPVNLTYQIYTNNSVVPASIPGVSLSPNPKGELFFTVANLQINTTYDFSVGVKDAKTGASSENNKSMSAKTFANLTADFQGISNVKIPAGVAGKTTLDLEWVPATVSTIALALPYPQDPVGYEVKYISKILGTSDDLNDPNNSDVVIKQFPTNITGTTPATDMRTVPIPGLSPGTTYYFQVRAIHKAYVDFGAIPSYQREQNTRFFQQTTTSNSGVFSLSSDQLNAAAPKAGKDQKDKMELEWFPATGAFYEYRVYWDKIGDPNRAFFGTPADCTVWDEDSPTQKYNCLEVALGNTIDDAKIVALNGAGEKVNGDAIAGYMKVNANNTFATVKSLTAYAYYNFMVVACENATCGPGNRVPTKHKQKRVIPTAAPFTGINNIDHPGDPTLNNKIKMHMDPPVVTSGYIDSVDVYCYDGITNSTPVILPNNGTAVSDPGTACHNAMMKTPAPGTLASFSNYDEVDLELDSPFSGTATVSTNKYCFAIVPNINGDYGGNDVYDYPYIDGGRDLTNAVFKCIVPEIKVPTIENFPGRTLGCNVSANDINVSWTLPSDGIYTNFVVFWKEKNSDPFLFSGAVADLGTNTNYESSIDTNGSTFISDTDTTYTISSLTPGKRYQFGVLAFIDDATPADRKFSEYNIRTDDCAIPLPKAQFKELMNVFAVGPKEDGLGNYTAGVLPTLLETIDVDGLPADVKIDADGVSPTTEFTERFGSIGNGSSDVFNGAFGAKADDFGTNPLFKYSDSGIVRFAFKDFELDDGLSIMQHGINNGEIDAAGALLITKSAVKYGYKVFRSDDGKVTWQDLTDVSYDFQDPDNIGLVTASPITYRTRNNLATISYNGVSFTDYSVSAEANDPGNNLIARAKTLFYKVIPYYNGGPIEFLDSTRTDHIIKVTLPPANMALIDRRVANRTICEEMGRSVLDAFLNPNPYYSCFFNGVGSSGLSAPWTMGTTVYDQGGDLLVDRFELGCNYTRGDEQNQKSVREATEASSYDFRGNNNSGSKLQGCNYSSSIGSIGPSDDPLLDGSPFVSGNFEVRKGDCFHGNYTRRPMTACGGGQSSTMWSYFSPGLDLTTACDDGGADTLVGDYFDVREAVTQTYATNVAQSEFAAVSYSRVRSVGDTARLQPVYRGAAGKLITPNGSSRYPTSCLVNLPSIAGEDDGTDDPKKDGRFKPRWIALNMLERLTYDGATNFDLIDSTINDVLSDSRLYDLAGARLANDDNPPIGAHIISAKKRFESTTPLGRMMTSNSSKLPPLGMMSQDLSQRLCGQYKVDVGLGTAGSFTKVGTTISKRILRRKEHVAVAAWPRHFDFQETSELERGIRSFSPVDGASPLPNDNSSCNSARKDSGAGQGSSNLKVRDFITTLFPFTAGGAFAVTTDSLLITGSSIYDGDSSGGAEPGLNTNSQKCQSRFGVQDLVGNTEEYTSDQIFCDFSSDQLKYGTYGGDPDSATIGEGTEYNAGAGRAAWVQFLPDSGRCSMVQSGSLRSNVSALGGISFLPPYFSDGTVNSSVVLTEKAFDKDSINDARNGDGYFLDFGFDTLGPPIKEHDTMGLVFDSTILNRAVAGSLGTFGGTDPRRAKYFSPTLGIPLECDGIGCDNSNDNKLFSTEALLCRACSNAMTYDINLNLVVDGTCSCDAPGPLGISVDDFPVNNSQFYSRGVSEKNSSSSYYHVREAAPGWTTTFSYRDLNTGSSPYTLTSEGPMSTDISVGADPAVSTREVYWSVSRGQPMYMKNGGRRTQELNGRYTASLEGSHKYNQGAIPETGTRCVIKFNESGDY